MKGKEYPRVKVGQEWEYAQPQSQGLRVKVLSVDDWYVCTEVLRSSVASKTGKIGRRYRIEEYSFVRKYRLVEE